MRAKVISEHDIQAVFVLEAEYEFRNDPTWKSELFYAVLNGAWIAGDENKRRKSALLTKYKAEGWKPGVPDVHYDQPRGTYNKLIIEFKRADRRRDKNGGLSDEQLQYTNAAAPYAMVRVCYSTDEALKVLRGYMALPQTTPAWTRETRLLEFHKQFHHDRALCEICKLETK